MLRDRLATQFNLEPSRDEVEGGGVKDALTFATHGDATDAGLLSVFRVSETLGSEHDESALLERIARETESLLDAERVAVFVGATVDDIRCVAGCCVHLGTLRETGVPTTVVSNTLRTLAPILTNNAAHDMRLQSSASVAAQNVRSIICAPLATRKSTYGCIYVDSTVESNIFSEKQRNLLGVFATQAAISLENARAFSNLEEINRSLDAKVKERTADLATRNKELSDTLTYVREVELKLAAAQRDALEQEMQLAQRIQQWISPAPLAVSEFGVAKVCGIISPASIVGGDFWGAWSVSAHEVLVFVGDVTGHGVGAGMVTTAARAAIDTWLSHAREVSLAKLLHSISSVIDATSGDEVSMTGWALVLNTQTLSARYAVAGHPPASVSTACWGS